MTRFGKENNLCIRPHAFEAALREIGAPLTVLELPDTSLRAVYERDLVLVRPDLRVAWRADAAPEEPKSVAMQVAGW